MTTYTFNQFQVSGFPRRQAEALALIASGHSTKSAAREMRLSPKTVEEHVANAMVRLHARNRVHLITQAFAAGLLQVREAAVMGLLLLAVGLAPSIDMPDDLSRYTSRHVKVRRGNRDPLFALLDGDDLDEEGSV